MNLFYYLQFTLEKILYLVRMGKKNFIDLLRGGRKNKDYDSRYEDLKTLVDNTATFLRTFLRALEILMQGIKKPWCKFNWVRLYPYLKTFLAGIHDCLQELMWTHLQNWRITQYENHEKQSFSCDSWKYQPVPWNFLHAKFFLLVLHTDEQEEIYYADSSQG